MLLVLVVLVRSGLPVLTGPVLVLVVLVLVAVLVLFVLFLLAVVVLVVGGTFGSSLPSRS